MVGARGNPKRKMRRDQPHALPRRHFHDAADGVDQLIGPVGMLWYLKPGRILIGQRRHGNTALRVEYSRNTAVFHVVSHCRFCSTIHPLLRAPATILYYYPFPSSRAAKILWGRLITCGRLVIGLPLALAIPLASTPHQCRNRDIL